MFAIVMGWWLSLLEPVTMSATTSARGATIGFARAESEYLCAKAVAASCAARELGPPTRVDTGLQCVEDDGIATCEASCAGECTAPASEDADP